MVALGVAVRADHPKAARDTQAAIVRLPERFTAEAEAAAGAAKAAMLTTAPAERKPQVAAAAMEALAATRHR